MPTVTMRSEDLVLVHGLRDTRRTLADWNLRPIGVLRSWVLGSAAVASAMLVAVWVGAHFAVPDPSGLAIPGLNRPVHLSDVGGILFRNSLVLALHSMACLAGFIAGSSLPLAADRYSGAWRWVHDRAGPLAIAFVSAATLFSLWTQIYVLSGSAATLSAQFHVSPAVLLISFLPHALPELTALFLPLAAWLIAARRKAWHELFAATLVTTALAIPVLILAALVEVYVSPPLLRALGG